MTTNPWVHPNERAEYWNQQGIRHLSGDSKNISRKEAEKCFRFAAEYGDNAALFNLALMMSKGFVENNNDELEDILNKLVSNGAIQEEEKYSLFGINEEIDDDEVDDRYKDWYERGRGKIPHQDLVLSRNPAKIMRTGLIFEMRQDMESRLRSQLYNKGKTEEELKGYMAGQLIKLSRSYGIIDLTTEKELLKFSEYAGTSHEDAVNRFPHKSPQIMQRWNDIINHL